MGRSGWLGAGLHLSSSEVNTLEAVPVVSPLRHSPFHSICSLDHRNLVVDVVRNTTLSAGHFENSSLSFLVALMADKPPGRFGSKEGANEDRHRPDPLNRERAATISILERENPVYVHSVCPLVIPVQKATQNTSSDKLSCETLVRVERRSSMNTLTHNPAKIHIGCQVISKDHRADFAGVGDGEGLEHPPRDALKDRSCQDRFDVLSEEGHEDESDHEDQRASHGLPVTDLLGYPAIEIKSDDAADLDTVVDTRLPDEVSKPGW
jgi:hypothetical protein